MTKEVSNKIISDKVVRERTFEIIQLRGDRKDVMGQLAVTIDKLLADGFTGCIEIHCSQGRVNNVKARESQRLPE